jgi:hypothetical protein
VLERLELLQPKLIEWGTSPQLAEAMVTGARAWVEGNSIPASEALNLSDNDAGKQIRAAYQEQTDLGWNVFFRGFWSSGWRLAQDEHWKRVGKSCSFDTGESWAGKAQLWFFDFFHQLWNARNANEYGEDIFTQRQIRLAKCEKTIRRLYLRSTELPEGEMHPFREPIETLLARPVADQELWIGQTVPFLRLATRHATKRSKAKQRAITEFYHLKSGAPLSSVPPNQA